ncbi:hypothetical protein Nepgr_032470 [Nepenthes gracilis]|uniref:BZIP domain-containing protein n=1 Tax=Nepenthes gracilis TaxID=150966 RepID=A0AAD3Y5S6_NEPGR|nr:hypothetical protein Nepgr_032470 [Nepenthes gracilis]
MYSSEVTRLHYLAPTTSPYTFPSSSFMTEQNNTYPFHISRYTPQIVQELNPQSTCFSGNSTSDDADELHLSIINERKKRRMISNRESARRSRMRKQRHLKELCSKVAWLRSENHRLVDKLTLVAKCHDRVSRENFQLEEEVFELRRVIAELQLDDPCSGLRELEMAAAAAYLGDESSNSPVTI